MSEGRLADRAYTGIVEMINADGLEVGDRLPSEARLAEIFGMSRTIVREALVRLAADSITEARRGAGSFVKNRPSDKLGAYMPLSELPSTLGSYEVRFVLEAEAARLAAARRSDEEMASIEAALSDLRQVVWEKGPVRCGYFTKEDGTQVPMYHDSEVAAVAFMLQRMLMKRGFLDASANQVPAAVLSRRYAARNFDIANEPMPIDTPAPAASTPVLGAKCPECGAHALHKVDGCRHCSECHYIGSCG